jgi:Tfp pilus assembly protein PilN
MKNRITLDLNLASKPRRNRRLYDALVRGLAVVLGVLVTLTAFVVVKYGGESARLKAASAETQKLQGEALREESRLTADVKREERLGRTRVDLVNGIILKKTFSWTSLFSELEKALPASSYITMLSPGFTAEGSSVAIRLRVTSRSLEDLLSLINNLSAAGFKGIQVGGETRNEEGRTIAEITLTYERAF